MMIDRRGLLGAAGSAAILPLAGCSHSQAITLTLPWLSEGATAYTYVAQQSGAFAKAGLKVVVSRGAGSISTAQAVSQRQFDFGIVGAGALILAAARGLPIVGLATFNYDMMMGIALRADSPIKTARDLAGKKLGAVPTAAEFPFWPAYARASGLDPSTVTVVQVDARVEERVLIDKQVDAVAAIGASAIPVMAAQGAADRFLPFSAAGISLYGNVLVTSPERLSDKPELCQRMVDALMEAFAFTLLEPEQALDMFIAQVPESAMPNGARETARLSQGLMQSTVVAPEAIDHSLGWSDLMRWNAMTDLVMANAAPTGARRPSADAVITNRFVGKEKLTADQWAGVKTRVAPFHQMLSG